MIRVGTDCSGIDAPIEALRQLGVPFEQLFASDTNALCRETIRAHRTVRIYTDVMKRDHTELIEPRLDLYVAGLPCQPYSTAGRNKRESDPRYSVYESIVKTINTIRPRVCVLENVLPFASLFDPSRFASYHAWVYKLNSANLGSIQNRRRLYIILYSREYPFRVLPHLETIRIPRPDACEYVDFEDTRTEIRPPFSYKCTFPPGVVFVGFEYKGRHSGPCCTLLSGSRLWNFYMGRFVNGIEARRLMGFPDKYAIAGSPRQVLMQLGNSMELCALKLVLKTALSIINV